MSLCSQDLYSVTTKSVDLPTERPDSLKELLQLVLREPSPKDFPGRDWVPYEAQAFWKTIEPVAGLASSPPSDIRLLPPQPAARIFDCPDGSPINAPRIYYAALSLREDSHFVPPHPGV